MSSSDHKPLVDWRLGVPALAIAVVGWVVGGGAPPESPLQLASYVVGAIAFTAFVLVAGWRSYRRNFPNAASGETSEPQANGAQAGADSRSLSHDEVGESQGAVDDRPARTIHSEFMGYPMAVLQPIPLWILLAAFPYLYGWGGTAKIPALGTVPFPPAAFSVLALLAFAINYWIAEHVFEYA